MRVGQRLVVITNEGVRHPVGTLVEVKIIGTGIADKKPYYCQAVDGETCYWYGKDDLAVEVDGIKA
jgi:hypothetical protein